MIIQFPDPSTIIKTLLDEKSLPLSLKICTLRPGVPCKPMLAKPTKSLG